MLIVTGPGASSLFHYIAAREGLCRRPLLFLSTRDWTLCVFDIQQNRTRVFEGDETSTLPKMRNFFKSVLCLVDFGYRCPYECADRFRGSGLFIVHLSKLDDNYYDKLRRSPGGTMLHVLDPPTFADVLEMYATFLTNAVDCTTDSHIADVGYTNHPTTQLSTSTGCQRYSSCMVHHSITIS